METTQKNSDAGYLAKVDLENTTILNISTKANNYRWWKIYFQDKVFLILSWQADLTTFNWEHDITRSYTRSDWLITIPAKIPNIFYFPENTEMIEWFPKNTETKKYDRYRELKK